MQQPRTAIYLIAFRWLAGGLGASLLSGCAALFDAPRLPYLCPNALLFDARLYRDMALLEGLRGHVVLERVPSADAKVLHYGDPTMQARFGLGVDTRLARLDYSGIPEPVHCERIFLPGEDVAPVRASDRAGPRPPPPRPDPNAPVPTNIRSGDDDPGPG